MDEIALTMAQQGVIWPVGTRGMCGRVSEDKIIYDAPTAIGGSGGPVIGLLGIYALRGVGVDISQFAAQVLLISTAMPTAVNAMLLCLEFDNHPEFAARAVFTSTLISPITVTLVVFLAQSGILPGLQI